VAVLETRGNSVRLQWRLGGLRTGARQSTSFTGPDLKTARTLAEQAKAIVEAHQHRLTRDELLALVLDEPEQVPTGMPTLEEWVRQWIESRTPIDPARPSLEEIQMDTLRGYETELRTRVLPWLGHKYLHEITEEVAKDWIRTLRTRPTSTGRPLSASSIRRTHAVLHQVLGTAVPQYLAHNPLARTGGTRRSRIGLPRVLPFDGAMYLHPWEVEVIHRHCPPPIKDLWWVMVRTGLRLGEAVVLRPADVTIEGDSPEIRVSRALKRDGVIGAPKSAKGHRVVTVSTEVAKVLAARCLHRKASDLLFPTPRGGMWNKHNLRHRYWQPAIAAAMRCQEHPPPLPPKSATGPRRGWRDDEVSTCGCPGVLRRRPRIHDARHTHASDCIVRLRMLPIEVQHRLGHASYQTTMNIYGHLFKGAPREVLDSLDRAEGGSLFDDEDG